MAGPGILNTPQVPGDPAHARDVRKDRPANETRRSTDFTPAGQETALRFLAKRLGG